MDGQYAVMTPPDYRKAIYRMEELKEADPGTWDFHERNRLTEVLTEHIRTQPLTLAEAIESRLKELGLSRRDLVPILGSRSRVSEILAGKADISMATARALHQHLDIPPEILIQPPASENGTVTAEARNAKFPVGAIVKRGWVKRRDNPNEHAAEIVDELREKAGRPKGPARYRKNDAARVNANTDPHALEAWQWRILALAKEDRDGAPEYTATDKQEDLLREIAKLSVQPDGPLQAIERLRERGIRVVTEPHLPRTHLDGAAMLDERNQPVIGLTLRHNRLDNFWFTLLHELAHVVRHLNPEDNAIVDDLNIPATEETEREADRMARDALIPPKVWKKHRNQRGPAAANVILLAQDAGVHPAVAAGRIRWETKDYRRLSQFVGSGQPKELLKITG